MLKILKQDKKIILITICVLVFLSIIKKVYIFEFKYKDEENLKIRAMIINKEKETEEKISYIIKYDKNKFLLNIYNPENKDKEYNYADIIEFRGSINKIEKMNNPYEFDYKKYLNSNNIVTTMSSYNEIKCIGKSNGSLLIKVCNFIKESIGNKIDSIIPQKEANLYKSMIYGDDIYLDSDIKENFRKNGMSHILVASGMHLMYLILILDCFLKKSGSRKCKFIYYFFIICYLIMSGMGISVIRAGIMSILLINDKKDGESVNNSKRKYINIAISYVILIIYNPYVIFNISGIFSYLATIGIITFNSLIYSFFKTIIKVPKFSLSIFKILSTTFSSLIMLFPLQIYYFGEIELRLIISCILTSFLISFIFLVGFISLFLSFIPIISDILFNSLYCLMHVLIRMSEFISNIQLPTINLPKPSLTEMYLYYFSIFLLVIKKYIVLIGKSNIKRTLRKFINIFVIISFFLIVLMCIYRIYFEEYVVYFNVGQGNMSLIRNDRKVIIIDSGSTNENLASNILNNFLNAKAIEKIDLLVITHMHTDHMNGIYGIDAKVEKVGYSIPKEESEEFNRFLDYIDENNISRMELKKGDKITLKNITLNILLPYSNKVIKSSDIANSNSIVIMANIKEKNKYINLMYMGDATVETEKILLKDLNDDVKNMLNNISVLQVGHHGSKTSSSDIFLNSINVKLAVISSKKKVYGHPSKETLDKLNKYNIRYKITEIDGAIILNL